ncbi:zinc fingers and homeoboxes protein 1 isoform X2 [Rhincodon typus]|uniref:zinc fingers and homeoboxes protein 1 isoform X2 n=1 Tax=Rhincodon typus TaxID=259920 RepID=UPI00202EB83A|nr:zinc fingers and homeoboxes protein 1 isoform X2 [Rhincodon typus]
MRKMEGFGCEFDDSVFESFRERKAASGIKLGSYTAKLCEPRHSPNAFNPSELFWNKSSTSVDVRYDTWFWGEICTADDVEKLTALKFRGDLAFKHQDYQKALCEYSSSLTLVPESNIALRRDLQEAQARCLCLLGRSDDALDIAQKLRSEITNTDHLTTVLNLDILIYRNAGNLSEELSCLQQLISMHTLNPWYWKKLAECYLGHAHALLSATVSVVPVCKDGRCLKMLEKSAIETATSKTKADCAQLQSLSRNPCGQVDCKRQINLIRNASKVENSGLTFTSHVVSSYSAVGDSIEVDLKRGQQLRDLWLFACSSFVRARLLLQMVKAQQASFVLERNLTVQEEIRQELSNLELREEALNAISKVMAEDLLLDKFKNGAETEKPATFSSSSSLDCVTIESGSDFEQRWFKKLRNESFYCPIWK